MKVICKKKKNADQGNTPSNFTKIIFTVSVFFYHLVYRKKDQLSQDDEKTHLSPLCKSNHNKALLLGAF